MNILVLSISPWRNDNSVGNTLSNIFKDFPDANFANIYLKPGIPDNDVCHQYFQLNEKMLLQKNYGKAFATEAAEKSEPSVMNIKESSIYDFFRKKRYTILFLARECIWSCFYRKNKNMESFIHSFRPDIIFLLVNAAVYSNKIANAVKQIADKPMVGYVWDDVYAYSGKSPLRFFYQMGVRKTIRNTVSSCSYLYTISDIQRREYGQIFQKECRLLWKGDNFDSKPSAKKQNSPIKLVFTGNISTGRWETLAEIGRVISKINADKIKMVLDIYTLTPLSAKIKQELEIPGAVNLKGALPFELVKTVQREADILVHVESFGKKYKPMLRQSFSTKIVDYLKEGKCILAVGPSDVASIDYLIKNNAAVVAVNQTEIEKQLRAVCENPQLIQEFGDKAWECGRRNHQIKEIQNGLYHDFKELIDESSTN